MSKCNIFTATENKATLGSYLSAAAGLANWEEPRMEWDRPLENKGDKPILNSLKSSVVYFMIFSYSGIVPTGYRRF